MGINDDLALTIQFGVAFHNSDLTADERYIIERAYREGTIRVLAATSTISTGINLPAKAVMFDSLEV